MDQTPTPGFARELQDKGFLYAKIGTQDALAFPDLLAGSIVRVRPGTTGDMGGRISGEDPRICSWLSMERDSAVARSEVLQVGGLRRSVPNCSMPKSNSRFLKKQGSLESWISRSAAC